jgi:phenylpropionate dioxygenase-like ring-hydroxylating dioxygenase large terminal subunit
MNPRSTPVQPPQEIRIDFVPKDAYFSHEYVALEAERLWPRVWQVACREEELKEVGDYVTYEVAHDSIIVVRTAEGLRAHHNTCQHRGRKLTEGCGKANQFRCKYHGWRWNLDGSLGAVLDHEDWNGCPEMGAEDLRLSAVRVDTWGGFVFVNMDSNAQPLREFLAPVIEHLDCFEFEKLRYRWYKSVRLPCNWKVAQEAFNEGYHVAATHPQILPTQGDDRTTSVMKGPHGMFHYLNSKAPIGAPSPRLNLPFPADLRPGIIEFHEQMERELKAIYTPRDVKATHRLMDEVPAETPPMEMIMKTIDFQRQAAIEDGAGWPEMSLEQFARAGTDWHVFPNLVMLMYPDGLLAYRSRPDGDDPDSCIYEIYSLARYAPGTEPPLKREYYHRKDEWREDTVGKFGFILSQDFNNMEHVQQGMKSRGFRASRPNPVQETSVSNFHRELLQYLFGDAAPKMAAPSPVSKSNGAQSRDEVITAPTP